MLEKQKARDEEGEREKTKKRSTEGDEEDESRTREGKEASRGSLIKANEQLTVSRSIRRENYMT